MSQPIQRRTFNQWLVASTATVAAPWVHAAQKLEKSTVSLAVGGKGAFYYLPLTIAEQLGYFKDEGVELKISDFAGGSKALQAVVGGSADVCSGAYEHTINLQARNQFFQSFVLQGRAPAISLGVSNKTMPDYKSVKDLKGKKIGVTAPGSSTNMVANLILSRAGMKPTDVSFIGVGTSAGALSALRSGQIDAICNIDPVITMLEQKADIRIITDTRTLKGTREVFGGNMPAGCLYAPLKFIQENPNTTQALTNAMVRALKWLQTAGPSDIIKTVPENYLLGDRALYLAAFNNVREAISIDGVVESDGPKTALSALSSFNPKVKSASIDLSKTYTNQFALQAKKKYKA
jgi:NitT/TauT family transport system substrate-binding protein